MTHIAFLLGSANMSDYTTSTAGMKSYYAVATYGTWPDISAYSFTQSTSRGPILYFRVA